MGNAGPSGRVPLEALILSFAHSRAKALVGTDALRSVLSGQYRELLHEGTFDLEPVWQLLAQQPGFAAEHVRPALCRFKTWEAHLGVTVRMPESMTGLNEFEIKDLAAHVHVPVHERRRVFGGALVPPDDPEAAAVDRSEGTIRPPSRAPSRAPSRPSDVPEPVPQTTRTRRLRRLTPRQRRTLEITAMVLGLAGFSLAGLQLQHSCSTTSWEEMSTRFAGDIPIGAAERQGPEVSGDLRDQGWVKLPPAVRTAQMKAALEALPLDVQAFFVRDRDRQVRAVARWFGQPRQVQVTLQ